MEEKNKTDDTDIKDFNFDLINKISKEEINAALSSYEIIGNTGIGIGAVSGILGGLAGIGGVGAAGLAGLGTVMGFGGLASMGITGLATGGVGLVVFLVGFSIVAIAGTLKEKSQNKGNENINNIKELEEKIKNPETLENKIFSDFNTNMCGYLQQKLSSLIIEEHNKLINIAYNIKLDDQRIFDINGEKLLIKVKENIPDFHELDKFGILVLGKTGVGKTTLINAILDQEEKGTTIGLPMTMKTPQIKHFNRSLFPSLDIWDSRGLELADEFSIEQNSQQVINFVKNGLKQDENENKSMNFIHCIWYCVTGTRIEKTELDYIKKLKSIYSSDKKLPIIFVYTQADNEEFIEPIKNTIIKELKDPNIKFIDVVSKETKFKVRKQVITIGKRGLRKLMEESLNLAKQGFESAFFGNIQKQFKNLLIYFMSKKPFIESLKIIKDKLTTLVNEKKKLKYFYESFPDFLNDSLPSIYFDAKNLERNKTENKFNLEEWKKDFINLYKKKFDNILKSFDKDKFNCLINDSIKKYYDEAFDNEIKRIHDFDFMTQFQKNVHKEEIHKLLDPKKNDLEKIFKIMLNNILEHKESFLTNFIIEFLTREFFQIIAQRLESMANSTINKMKNQIDKEVQMVAKEIYDNLSNSIDITKIPKDEDEDEE